MAHDNDSWQKTSLSIAYTCAACTDCDRRDVLLPNVQMVAHRHLVHQLQPYILLTISRCPSAQWLQWLGTFLCPSILKHSGKLPEATQVIATRTVSKSDAEVYKTMQTSFYGHLCEVFWGRFQGPGSLSRADGLPPASGMQHPLFKLVGDCNNSLTRRCG